MDTQQLVRSRTENRVKKARQFRIVVRIALIVVNSSIREISVISSSSLEEKNWAVGGSLGSEFLWQNHYSGGAGQRELPQA